MVDFADLDDGLEGAMSSRSAAKAKSAPTFPCQSCGGTGKYSGARVHQEKSHCFACGGKGHFMTSAADRYKARTAAKARKVSKLDAAKEAFNAEFPGVVDLLTSMSSWADIARDMLSQYNERGSLSARQVEVIRSMAAKAAATRAAREAEKQEAAKVNAVAVDLSPIHAMFDKAASNGLKRMSYRAKGLVLSPAKAVGRNPGAIYVKSTGGEYLGKVVGQSFMTCREATAAHKSAIVEIAANPSKVASDYGRETGECSCCGRELTDPASIAAGIGPVCAANYGL